MRTLLQFVGLRAKPGYSHPYFLGLGIGALLTFVPSRSFALCLSDLKALSELPPASVLEMTLRPFAERRRVELVSVRKRPGDQKDTSNPVESVADYVVVYRNRLGETHEIKPGLVASIDGPLETLRVGARVEVYSLAGERIEGRFEGFLTSASGTGVELQFTSPEGMRTVDRDELDPRSLRILDPSEGGLAKGLLNQVSHLRAGQAIRVFTSVSMAEADGLEGYFQGLEIGRDGSYQLLIQVRPRQTVRVPLHEVQLMHGPVRSMISGTRFSVRTAGYPKQVIRGTYLATVAQDESGSVSRNPLLLNRRVRWMVIYLDAMGNRLEIPLAALDASSLTLTSETLEERVDRVWQISGGDRKRLERLVQDLDGLGGFKRGSAGYNALLGKLIKRLQEAESAADSLE